MLSLHHRSRVRRAAAPAPLRFRIKADRGGEGRSSVSCRAFQAGNRADTPSSNLSTKQSRSFLFTARMRGKAAGKKRGQALGLLERREGAPALESTHGVTTRDGFWNPLPL